MMLAGTGIVVERAAADDRVMTALGFRHALATAVYL